MSRRPGYFRDYYTANRGRILARLKAWRKRNLEHRRAVEAAWRKTHREAEAAKMRRYRQKPEAKAKAAAYKRAARKANPEKARAAERAHYAKIAVRKRELARIAHAKAMLRKGKLYRPRFQLRLPEWAPVGGARDVRSQWLEVNVTDSQRAYARELAIERSQR